MNTFWFENAYLPSGWEQSVRISVNDAGVIDDIEIGDSNSSTTPFEGFALPGFVNAHSHAFQRAMSGLSEVATSPEDTFWTWRNVMYQCARAVTPKHLEAIAKQLYLEMLKAGYTSVAEFHYLHHQPNGRPYDDLIELSNAITGAAQHTGIGLTHLPVLYMSAGFGNQPLKPEQTRFANDMESYNELLCQLATELAPSANARLGMALHSLRAVPPDAIGDAISLLNTIDETAPTHIHIAEQALEVEDCLRWSGKRPVEWLLENYNVDSRWCLVHATHLEVAEITGIAQSGAVVGLCPTTEANLGDGLFPITPFLAQGGHIAIGSDSNTSVSPVEELRWLEYGQRLVHQKRNVITAEHKPHTGKNLVDLSLAGGAKVLGRPVGQLAPNHVADIIVLDGNSPQLHAKPAEYILDALVFSGNNNLVKEVIAAGNWVVRNYQHCREEAITADYLATIKHLRM